MNTHPFFIVHILHNFFSEWFINKQLIDKNIQIIISFICTKYDFKYLSLIQEYDPFIPPRGRKHENGKPNINGLIRQYNDLFVPNRGKKDNKERIRKDKIKDIFKYDDLFIPNRGKKCSDSKYFSFFFPSYNLISYINNNFNKYIQYIFIIFH